MLVAGRRRADIAGALMIARSTVTRIAQRLLLPGGGRVAKPSGHPGVGTLDGYHWHHRLGQPACPACQAAERAYARARHAGRREGRGGEGRHPAPASISSTYKRLGRPPEPIRHGTNAGYSAHRRRGERPCSACLAGHAFVSAARPG